MKTMRVLTSSIIKKEHKLTKVSKDVTNSPLNSLEWNNRFHLDKLQSFNVIKDQNSKIYQVTICLTKEKSFSNQIH